jgi:signal transduction histidine kinase
MLETLRVLNSSQPFDTVLSHITKQARELLGTAAVALYRLDPEDDVLRIQATLGLPEHYSREIELPLGHGALGRALVEARPVVVTDVPAFVAGENDRDSEGNEVIVSDRVRAVLREMTHLYGALVAVPVAVRGEAYGGLALYYPEPRTFSDEEIDLVTAFADQAALAIENERARIQTERAAAVAERQRLARELHDSVSQALYGIGLGARTALAWLDRAGASGDGAVLANLRRPLDYILGLAESGLTEMRSLIFKLHPEKLEEEGLSAALQQYTDRLARRDIAVESELCEEVDADLSVKEALYRIAQEAMNNVLKHAKATRVVLRLRCDVAGSGRGTLVLEVEDDGIGFDASACYPGHLGLTSMRERVEKLDGDLVIDSAPGAGTHLRVSVPV